MTLLPLNSVRVLDLSRVLAGPLCTMMLGDLGAHVIKVERPGRGDDSREWGPPFDATGASAYYLAVNRNKLSIAADLRRDGELIRRLASSAHVVVENHRPGALDRAGIRMAELLEANPALVWCSITGFGAGATRPGYDFVVQAESGWMAITGVPDGEPMKSGVALVDVLAGKDAAVAILAALAGIGRGASVARLISISLVDSARAALINVAQNVMVSGRDSGRWGNAHSNLVPYQLFHASDQAIVIAAGTDEQWKACALALGLERLASDPALSSNRGRIAERERIVAEMARAVKGRTAADLGRALDQAGVPNGRVKSVLEAIRDAGSASPVFGMPSSVGGSMRLPPPSLDQHGDLIRRLGWVAFEAPGGA